MDKYPVLYIIHGYGGNEDTWMPELKLDKKADELIDSNKIAPLIIVAPLDQKGSPSNFIERRFYHEKETCFVKFYCCNRFIYFSYILFSRSLMYLGATLQVCCVLYESRL